MLWSVAELSAAGGPARAAAHCALFPRYVQEVIQRGRCCIRPACTPVLSAVPAVSDLELSETEYVRPPGSSQCRPARDGSSGAAPEELGLLVCL